MSSEHTPRSEYDSNTKPKVLGPGPGPAHHLGTEWVVRNVGT